MSQETGIPAPPLIVLPSNGLGEGEEEISSNVASHPSGDYIRGRRAFQQRARPRLATTPPPPAALAHSPPSIGVQSVPAISPSPAPPPPPPPPSSSSSSSSSSLALSPAPSTVYQALGDCLGIVNDAQDQWAMLVYFVFVIVFGSLSLWVTNGWLETLEFQGYGIHDSLNDYGPTTSTIILFVFVLALSVIISGVYFISLKNATKHTVWFTAAVNAAIGLGGVIYCAWLGQYLVAVGLFLFAAFYAFLLLNWRDRMSFPVTMIEKTMDIADNFGHVFTVSILGGTIAVIFAVYFIITFVSVYIRFTPDPNNPACTMTGGLCSKAKLISLLVYVMFGGYWMSEIIKNSIHVSVSCVFSSWYLLSHEPERLPDYPTLKAVNRALWYSFGSIVYGSLASSIVQFLHQPSSVSSEGDYRREFSRFIHATAYPAAWLLQFFNHYAYSRLAFMSGGYTQNAKRISRLLKEREIDVVVNNNLVDQVLTAGAVFSGNLCAIFSYLYLMNTNPSYNSNGDFTSLVMAISFLIGLQMFNICLVSVKSGVVTICTSMASDPDTLRMHHQSFFFAMVGAYHKVAGVSSFDIQNIL